MTNMDLVAKAKATFKDELGELQYRPLLPVGQDPPATLNYDKMEPFRAAMRKHYLSEKPEFI